jgi:hypothetical protein
MFERPSVGSGALIATPRIRSAWLRSGRPVAASQRIAPTA